MKKIYLYAMLIVMAVFAVVSCNEPDENTQEQQDPIKMKVINDFKKRVATNRVLPQKTDDVIGTPRKYPCKKYLPDCEPTIETYTINGTSQYPDCNFLVRFEVSNCNGVLSMMYLDFAPWPVCSELNEDTDGPNAGTILDTLIDELMDLAIISEVIATYPGEINYCDQEFKPTVNLYKSACYKLCAREVKDDKDGSSYLWPYRRPCGEGCCISTLKVCIDRERLQLAVEPIKIESTGDCTAEYNCKEGDFFLQECRTSCPSVNE